MTDYTELVKALRWCANAEICTEEKNCGYWSKEPFCTDSLMTDAAAAIEALQAELNSITIYDYSVDKLIMFAEMCKRNDVQERDLKQAAWNLELAVRAVMNERQEIIKNAVGEITMRCTPDFEKAFKEMRDGAKMEVQE